MGQGPLDRGERLMGFGHRVYRAEDPRARVLRRTAEEIGATRYEVAEALEQAALAELQARKPDRVLATNVEFWSAVVLDLAEVPPELFTSMFTCARVAGWSAHILEQKREGRLIRPTAKYVGPGPRRYGAADAAPPLGPVALAQSRVARRWSASDRARERLRGRVEALGKRSRSSAPRAREHEHLDAPVVLGGAALDQAAVLEAVDDPRDVGVVAVQLLASSLIGRGSLGGRAT